MPLRRRTLIAAGSASAALLVLCTFCNGPIDAASTGCGAAAPAASPPAGGYTRPWAAAAPAEEEPAGLGPEEEGVTGDLNGDGEDDLVVFPVMEDMMDPGEVRLSGAEGRRRCRASTRSSPTPAWSPTSTATATATWWPTGPAPPWRTPGGSRAGSRSSSAARAAWKGDPSAS
ncbi:hypothetical protein ACFQXA_05450 [Nocardiopsis composta]